MPSLPFYPLSSRFLLQEMADQQKSYVLQDNLLCGGEIFTESIFFL